MVRRGAGDSFRIASFLTDAAHRELKPRAEVDPAMKTRAGDHQIDLSYTCPGNLQDIAAKPGWWTPGYATAQVLLDKTGEVMLALRRIAERPEEKAIADTRGWFDAYLNAFYRSLKAWRRGDELGGRLQAAESAMHLVRTLFSLERRWPPYHDRLHSQLQTLEQQGWPPGYLRDALLGLVRTGDPTLQQEIAARVEALLRARGYGDVLDAWDGEIERVMALRFE
jgi:hypothetical protein